jgi:hypothetical protein
VLLGGSAIKIAEGHGIATGLGVELMRLDLDEEVGSLCEYMEKIVGIPEPRMLVMGDV